MVRAGGSASRTIDDSDAPDPGGEKRALEGRLTPAEEKRRDRRFQIAAIWWWRETRRWNRPRRRSWVEVVWLLLGAM